MLQLSSFDAAYAYFETKDLVLNQFEIKMLLQWSLLYDATKV